MNSINLILNFYSIRHFRLTSFSDSYLQFVDSLCANCDIWIYTAIKQTKIQYILWTPIWNCDVIIKTSIRKIINQISNQNNISISTWSVDC